MSVPPTDPIFDDDPAMVAYARERGLVYERHWFAPDATQLLRHGFMPDGWDNMKGVLPGGETGHLMHWDHDAGRGGQRRYTVALIGVPESIALGPRVVCHDRDLPADDATNPEADDRVVSLDDQAVRLESDEFTRRYTLAADHDQDQVGVWALFDPSLVLWMTSDAPAHLSFELQDGSLCVFVPGWSTDPYELDRFCEAACRIAGHVRGASRAGAGAAAPVPGAAVPGDGSGRTQDDAVSRELAKAVFAEPPADVRQAATAFRVGPVRTAHSWRLGAEAFFREYAGSLGMHVIEPSVFRAAHLDYEVPALLDHAATGYVEAVGAECFLLFSGVEDSYENGFVSLVADLPPGRPYFMGFISQEGTDDGFQDWTNGHTFGIWKQGGGQHSRTREEMDRFMAYAGPEMRRQLSLAGGS